MVGHGYDYDGVPEDDPVQCVDLIKYYYEYLGVRPVLGSAYEYVYNALPQGWQRIAGAKPQKGDILIYLNNDYGHVAIYESEYSSYHQNFNNHKYVEHVTYAYNGLRDNYWGVVRPDFGGTSEQISVKFEPWTTSNYTYIRDTDASVGYHIITNGNWTTVGIYVYDKSGTQIGTVAWPRDPQYTYYYFMMNEELGITLKPSTTYTYKVYAVVSGKTYYSNLESFKTTGTPKVTFVPVSNTINEKIASLNQTVMIEGGDNWSDVGVILYDNANKKIASAEKKVSSTATGFSFDTNSMGVTLAPETTYKYRFTATVDGVTYNSEVQTFTTTKAIEQSTLKLVWVIDGKETADAGEIAKCKVNTSLNTFERFFGIDSYYSKYSKKMDVGSSYTIEDIVVKDGYKFDGVISGNLKGRTEKGGTTVKIKISSIEKKEDKAEAKSSLQIFCVIDNVVKNDISGFASMDILIDGKTASFPAEGRFEKLSSGTAYMIRNITAKEGYRYNGLVMGELEGTVNDSPVTIILDFSTKDKTDDADNADKTDADDTFDDADEENSFDISDYEIELTQKRFVYNGKKRTPEVVIDGLEEDVDYEVSYSDNINVGYASVMIRGIGSYSGEAYEEYLIKPKATSLTKVTATKSKITARFKKQTAQVSGYQIQVSTSSKFTSSTTKNKTVKGKDVTSAGISSLKSNKAYYVRIRTYKTVDGEKIYSSWSDVEKVKTK